MESCYSTEGGSFRGEYFVTVGTFCIKRGVLRCWNKMVCCLLLVRLGFAVAPPVEIPHQPLHTRVPPTSLATPRATIGPRSGSCLSLWSSVAHRQTPRWRPPQHYRWARCHPPLLARPLLITDVYVLSYCSRCRPSVVRWGLLLVCHAKLALDQAVRMWSDCTHLLNSAFVQ